MAYTHSFPDLLLQMKTCFDHHFFTTKQQQMFLNPNRLFIYSLSFFFFRNELPKLATEGEFVAKVEVLAALVTVLVASLSPATKNFGFRWKLIIGLPETFVHQFVLRENQPSWSTTFWLMFLQVQSSACYCRTISSLGDNLFIKPTTSFLVSNNFKTYTSVTFHSISCCCSR